MQDICYADRLVFGNIFIHRDDSFVLLNLYSFRRMVLTEEELAYFQEKDLVVYCLEEGQTEKWPAAIKIDDLPFVKKYIRSNDSVFFALSGSTQKPDACRAIWEYINAWEEPKQ